MKEIQQYDSSLIVTEENTSEIFQMLDHDNDGFLNLSEIDQLLDTILPAYEESISVEEPSENLNRGSLYFDSTQKRFTYMRTKEKEPDRHKIGSSILNSLSLDKISELKYIYHLADLDNKGFAEFERIINSNFKIIKLLDLY